jgi:hypothetical protein
LSLSLTGGEIDSRDRISRKRLNPAKHSTDKNEESQDIQILTNGVLLTPSLVRELKNAGAYGFVFHVDSRQNRSGWEGVSESELNSLRQHYADMISDEGGSSAASIQPYFQKHFTK